MHEALAVDHNARLHKVLDAVDVVVLGGERWREEGQEGRDVLVVHPSEAWLARLCCLPRLCDPLEHLGRQPVTLL